MLGHLRLGCKYFTHNIVNEKEKYFSDRNVKLFKKGNLIILQNYG